MISSFQKMYCGDQVIVEKYVRETIEKNYDRIKI